ncbi:aminotransferase class I/II-fold pyridoxal phosphate-dependent enzyme [Euzebyella marina]|uniref:Aminotransferase class I/II-fold pyridoxal phosphate-dependent enzyme n=1 Tax=Euzebyella marina TaxID=1761453 RepID=A0A3G2L1R2_9FLAO|nr:methionine aminotransferase [Euzebyella marina]AYN66146.1 aminotransferase class I/II-fold pyridoxal phosphate-dependent enzyme [Euzebyella marina]
MQAFKNPGRSKLPNVGTTIFTTVGILAKQHRAIDLSQGFPNFEADPRLFELVNKVMHEGYNQYAPMQGDYSLRETIANKIEKLHGTVYHPEMEITVTVGATQAIFTAIAAFISPGDEVIILKPAYDCYEPAIELNGGIPVPIQMGLNDYAIDWDALKNAITPKTKMLVLNTPHNPSGKVFSKNELQKLETILEPTDIIVVSDEVYEHIVFDENEHISLSQIEGLANRSFICASFGKTFHVTGWKVGYCAAPSELMKEFRKVHQFAVFCVDHPTQKAMNTYLQDESLYLGLKSFYQKKRDFFLNALNSSRFTYSPCEGTYFQLLNYSQITNENDEAFARRLIIEFGIACIPISSFNLNRRQDGVLRFCFAKKNETLEKAAEILCGL